MNDCKFEQVFKWQKSQRESCAKISNSFENSRYLIEHISTLFVSGATIDSKTCSGLTSLHLACESGHLGVVGKLLDHSNRLNPHNLAKVFDKNTKDFKCRALIIF